MRTGQNSILPPNSAGRVTKVGITRTMIDVGVSVTYGHFLFGPCGEDIEARDREELVLEIYQEMESARRGGQKIQLVPEGER